MKTITFAVQKGGTGKTSIAVSVAIELANAGKKTLLIDADPQGNATTWIDVGSIEYELADVLMKKKDVSEVIIPTDTENLSILPTASIGGNLKTYSKTLANSSPNAMKHIIKKVEGFDFCIIDTSPAFGGLEEACLLASNEAVSVLRLEDFSKDGLITFIENIKDMRERHDCDEEDLLLNKIVLNARDHRIAQQNDYYNEMISSTNAKLFVVPIDQAFPKAQKFHYPIQILNITKKETLEVIKNLAESFIG